MFVLKQKGYSLRAIAGALGRSASTISDELKRNAVAGVYTPTKAHTKSVVKRKAAKYQGMKIVQDTALQDFVEQHLLQGQSPEAIAGRLATGRDGVPAVSADSIYRYIASAYGRRVEYELMRLKTMRRRLGPRRPVQPESLSNRTFIDDRPEVVTRRERVGDLEADFIVSGKGGNGYLLTAVDRKIRYGFIRKVLPVTIGNAQRALEDIRQQFPELASITLDNDILFRYHEQLAVQLGVPLYFCHPYHSWEKGTVENFNKQVRKYVKKSSDISQYSNEYLHFVTNRLNARYMSVLGYMTPTECLKEYRMQQKTPS